MTAINLRSSGSRVGVGDHVIARQGGLQTAVRDGLIFFVHDQFRADVRSIELLRGIDAPQMAFAFAVLRVLADANVDFVLVDDRRADLFSSVVQRLLFFPL